MTDVIKQCAEALWNELCPGIRKTPGDDEHYRAGVRAVLQSLRDSEPTQEMLDRGCGFVGCWEAMLTAALGESAK